MYLVCQEATSWIKADSTGVERCPCWPQDDMGVTGDSWDTTGTNSRCQFISENGEADTAADTKNETKLSRENCDALVKQWMCTRCEAHQSKDSYFREAWEKAKARIATFFGGEKAPKKLLSYAPVISAWLQRYVHMCP